MIYIQLSSCEPVKPCISQETTRAAARIYIKIVIFDMPPLGEAENNSAKEAHGASKVKKTFLSAYIVVDGSYTAAAINMKKKLPTHSRPLHRNIYMWKRKISRTCIEKQDISSAHTHARV